MTAKYDLSLTTGSNFDFWAQYLSDGNTGIDLVGYDVTMQVMRYRGDPIPLLIADTRGLTYGYTGGVTTGIKGVGGISMNTYYDLTGITGGMFVKIGASTTEKIPYGNHFYDLSLVGNANVKQKLLEGRFRIDR